MIKKYLLVLFIMTAMLLNGGYALAATDGCCLKTSCACVKGGCCANGECACKGDCCTKDSCQCANGKCGKKCGCQAQ
jgi:hypothetical protein